MTVTLSVCIDDTNCVMTVTLSVCIDDTNCVMTVTLSVCIDDTNHMCLCNHVTELIPLTVLVPLYDTNSVFITLCVF